MLKLETSVCLTQPRTETSGPNSANGEDNLPTYGRDNCDERRDETLQHFSSTEQQHNLNYMNMDGWMDGWTDGQIDRWMDR